MPLYNSTNGVPVKAVAAELNTGTDDAKFATAASILGSYLGGQDGWSIAPTMAYNSANSLIAAPGVINNIISKNMRIKLTDGTVKYFTVSTIATDGGGNQIIFLAGQGTDTLSGGAVSNIYYSNNYAPYNNYAPTTAYPGASGNVMQSDGTNWISNPPVVQPTRTKVISASRDGTASSGDVSYTGVGFMPTSIICYMAVNATLYTSEATSDSSKTTTGKYQAGANLWYSMATLASYTNYSGWAQTAIIKSYDADGFTLTWTKAGTVPAGTMQLGFICYY